MSRHWRQPYEFSEETKRDALKRSENRCEECGVHEADEQLYIHHILSCFIAKHRPELSPEMIRSLANARVLCSKHHREADRYNESLTENEIMVIAIALFGMVQSNF